MKKTSVISTILLLAMLICSFIPCFATENLEDGTYTVNIALWHAEDDKESMAASAINEKAYIVVENGVKTMHIKTGKMTMMLITASLQELKIADSEGNYTDAVVESTDSDGNPTGFYFELPHTEEYIVAKVNPHISLMGNRDISARFKVDYSTLAKAEDYALEVTETTTLPVTTTQPETTTQVETTTAETTTQPETTTQEITTSEETTIDVSTTEEYSEEYTELTPVYEENENDSNDSPNILKVIIIIAAVLIIAGIIAVVIIKKRK